MNICQDLCGSGHLRRYPAHRRYAGFRVHHCRQQEWVRPHLRCGWLRHRGRPVQGRSRTHQAGRGSKGCSVISWEIRSRRAARESCPLFAFSFYRYINKKENSMIFPLTEKKKYGIFYPERWRCSGTGKSLECDRLKKEFANRIFSKAVEKLWRKAKGPVKW